RVGLLAPLLAARAQPFLVHVPELLQSHPHGCHDLQRVLVEHGLQGLGREQILGVKIHSAPPSGPRRPACRMPPAVPWSSWTSSSIRASSALAALSRPSSCLRNCAASPSPRATGSLAEMMAPQSSSTAARSLASTCSPDDSVNGFPSGEGRQLGRLHELVGQHRDSHSQQARGLDRKSVV